MIKVQVFVDLTLITCSYVGYIYSSLSVEDAVVDFKNVCQYWLNHLFITLSTVHF